MSNGITETIGLDMGDRYTHYSILDQRSGDAVGTGRVRTTPESFARFLESYPQARVVLEVGTHSRWANQVAQPACDAPRLDIPTFLYEYSTPRAFWRPGRDRDADRPAAPSVSAVLPTLHDLNPEN